MLAGGRTRAELRRGGPKELIGRTAPDYGPPTLHPTAGAVLVAARAPLVAFNVELAPPATLEDARAIAALIREGGSEGLPGVRAIGVQLAHAAQVSTNIEDHLAATPADVVAAVRRHAVVAAAELVALAPEAALRDFPGDVALRNGATIEERLRRLTGGRLLALRRARRAVEAAAMAAAGEHELDDCVDHGAIRFTPGGGARPT